MVSFHSRHEITIQTLIADAPGRTGRACMRSACVQPAVRPPLRLRNAIWRNLVSWKTAAGFAHIITKLRSPRNLIADMVRSRAFSPDSISQQLRTTRKRKGGALQSRMYERLPLRSRNEKSDRKIENTEVKKEVSKKGSAVSQAKQPIWPKSKTYEKNMHGMASTLRGQATPASSQRRLGRVGPQVRRRRGPRGDTAWRSLKARGPLFESFVVSRRTTLNFFL